MYCGPNTAYKGWSCEGYFSKNYWLGWQKLKHISGLGYEGNYYDGTAHGEFIHTFPNGDKIIG